MRDHRIDKIIAIKDIVLLVDNFVQFMLQLVVVCLSVFGSINSFKVPGTCADYYLIINSQMFLIAVSDPH